MNRRMAPLAVASLVLLLLPLVEADSVGSLESSRVSVAQGDLSGGLTLAEWHASAPEDLVDVSEEYLIEPQGLSITAAQAHITLYSSNWTATTEDPESMRERDWTLTNVTALGGVGDAEDARLVALAHSPGAATLSTAGWPLDVTVASGTRTFDNRIANAPDMEIDLSSSLQVAPAGDGLVRVTGSFRLAVNGLDLRLGSDGGESELNTRVEYGNVAGYIGKVRVQRATYAPTMTLHEAIIDLVDATVILPVKEVAVRSATIQADSTWVFEGATGSVQVPDGSKSISGEPVQINGALSAQVLRHGNLIGSTLDGSVSGLVVDGESVAAPSTVNAVEPKSPSAGWILALALVAVLAAAAHVAIGRWRFERLDSAMDRRDYGSALRLAGGFRGYPRLAQDAALAAAICLLALGRPSEAHSRLAARSRWAPPRRATRDFLLARAAAALGREGEAVRLLADCLMAEPSLLPQAEADPLLAAVLRGSRAPAPAEAYA